MRGGAQSPQDVVALALRRLVANGEEGRQVFGSEIAQPDRDPGSWRFDGDRQIPLKTYRHALGVEAEGHAAGQPGAQHGPSSTE
ncbi:hypothetical protein [Methylobacterium radiotolerans]|uniref:hypothetical protein n=1 Tax=Methylobacterium radiotolerans TaxID=31998 RepID=UPI0038D02943